MKNNFWFILVCILMYFIGYNMNEIALSIPKYKVALVDVASILEKSSEMKTLNKEQDKKTEELNILISKAQNELLNEHDRVKLMQKEAKYRVEIEAKKKIMEEDYTEKLEKITNNIKSQIAQEAKKSNYNLVLPTGIVISGGEDITEYVVKKIK